jgi:pantoate--beta-alanine ligase
MKMKTVTTFSELRAARAQLPEPVGFVPTMGYLHAGHLSLVRCAREECASVVVSIFVNPTQFGPGEDLEAYPRDIPRDLSLLEAEGVDLVWMPTPEVMYPPDFRTWVTVEEVTEPLEGAWRPGHFHGVTTVVAKLFNGVLPQKAYFGQKDAQQAVVIQQMTRDLNFPLEIVVCPIVREPDGLAMSSRNTYLNTEQRKAATVLYRALSAAKAAYEAGERDAERLRRVMQETIQKEPLARLQYVSVAHPLTLEELQSVEQDALLSMAVFVGKTRLIDNFLLSDGQWSTGVHEE